jgi:hypothetical protein
MAEKLKQIPVRTSTMQGIIDSFTKHFCAKFPGMYARVQQLADGDPRFVVAEALHILALASEGRVNMREMLGMGANPRGFPILQLYDFCFSLDIAVGNLKSEQARAQTGQDLDYLRHRVIPPDFRPDFYHLGQQYGAVDEKANVRTEGQEMGSRQIYEPTGVADVQINPASGLTAPGIRAKSLYERSVEDAYLLSFPSFNDIVALSQGLFRVFACSAAGITGALSVQDGKLLPVDMDPVHGRGSWINSFSISRAGTAGQDYVAPYERKDNVLKPTFAVLQPKCTFLPSYPNNRYMRDATASKNPNIPLSMYCASFTVHDCIFKHPVIDIANEGPRYGGGAIGTLANWSEAKAIRPEGKLTKCSTAFPMGNDKGFRDPLVLQTFGTVPAARVEGLYQTEECTESAQYVPLEDIYNVMRQMTESPIFICPELADSMRVVNIDLALNDLYESTQNIVWNAIEKHLRPGLADPQQALDVHLGPRKEHAKPRDRKVPKLDAMKKTKKRKHKKKKEKEEEEESSDDE